MKRPLLEHALSLLPKGAHIVETGCVRSENPDGDGMSTVLFAKWAAEHGGSLWSVDNDAEHLKVARRLTEPYAKHVTLVEADSARWLAEARMPIDLLYLDSWDYPYGRMLDEYGGKTDIHAAIQTLAAMPEHEVVARHRDLIEPSQRHALDELTNAGPRLRHGALVLIDDACLPGGGKARLARMFMQTSGWENLANDYQTLWRRP